MKPALVVLVVVGSVGLVDWVVDTVDVVVDQADGVADDSVAAVEVVDLVDPIDDLVVPADLVDLAQTQQKIKILCKSFFMILELMIFHF